MANGAALSLGEQLEAARAAVAERVGALPRIGLVLGSGLGAFAETLEDAAVVPYGEIPHMPKPTVHGHAGELCVGNVGSVRVAVLRGRVHLYEGHPVDRAVFGVRLLARLGCEAFILTNAAGGLRPSFRPGRLMLLSDHLNLMGKNPLVGPNHDELGPRFPDMTRAYDPELGDLARKAAAEVGVHLEEGVYAALLGPTYETPAEIRMVRTLGADAVGMSTVPEVIALRHMGARCAAVSCITNMGAGMTAATLSHDEVAETAGAVREEFMRLLSTWIGLIGPILDD